MVNTINKTRVIIVDEDGNELAELTSLWLNGLIDGVSIIEWRSYYHVYAQQLSDNTQIVYQACGALAHLTDAALKLKDSTDG